MDRFNAMSIDNFLKEYDHVLFDDHRIKLMDMKRFLSKYEGFQQITSKYGEHFTCCLWSNDEANVGPDTCNCYLVIRCKVEFQKLVKLYERLTGC